MLDNELVKDISSVISVARRTGKHVHLVCQTRDLSACRKILIGCSPRETSHLKGVASYPDGSKVSLCTLDDLPPRDTAFEVYFIEGSTPLTPDESKKRRTWRDAATALLSINMG